MTPYPATFYVAHAIFPTVAGQPWGSLTDGPADRSDTLDAAFGHFLGDMRGPTLATLRVWQMPGGADVTADFIEAIDELMIEAGWRSPSMAAE